MVKICPISEKQINENISRLNGIFTFFLVVGYFITGSPIVLIILLFDFVLRNLLEGRMNPVIKMNQYLVKVIDLPVHMINAGPKMFAARVGLILAATGIILYYFSEPELSGIPLVLLGIFSFLEGIFNYCVACKLYPYFLSVNRLFEKK